MSKQQPTTPAANETEPKPTKELSFGSKVGRGLTKLTELNDAERVELATSPDSIKARFAKRRTELLADMDPAVKNAVLAAAVAVEPKAAE